MKISFILSIVTIFFASSCIGQQGFPASWSGNWKGELQWFQTGKKEAQKVNMELRIRPADTVGIYTWQIIYGSETSDNRPYLLRAIDTTTGHWIIDERDGILLDQYYIGNQFCGAFTVQNSTIINSYKMEDGNLVVEFISMNAKPIATTGGTSKDVPAVDSYSVKSYQKAILKRY